MYITNCLMIDISKKIKTLRTAVAKATIRLKPETLRRIRNGHVPKGDPLPVAKVAAIQAAKNTSEIIPYCHPLPIEFVDCRFELGKNTIEIETEVKAIYKTGVEMEALVAASVAALTIYDMTKALDDSLEIVSIKLVKKTGGKSDFHESLSHDLRAAVLVLSDSVAARRKEDVSGKVIVEKLKEEGFEVKDYKVAPDNLEEIQKLLKHYADKQKFDLVITTGGTGLGPRDVTPEATASVLEREVPGLSETLRAYGQERMPLSMLSRGKAGVRGKTIIINLPGSKRAVTESLDALFPWLLHAFSMMEGEGH